MKFRRQQIRRSLWSLWCRWRRWRLVAIQSLPCHELHQRRCTACGQCGWRGTQRFGPGRGGSGWRCRRRRREPRRWRHGTPRRHRATPWRGGRRRGRSRRAWLLPRHWSWVVGMENLDFCKRHCLESIGDWVFRGLQLKGENWKET